MNTLSTLMRYKQWANESLYATAADLSEAELNAPRPIIFGSIIRTLNHVVVMDRAWQANLQNRDHGLTTRNPADHPPFDELRLRQSHIDGWYVACADSLSTSGEEETVNFTFIGGEPGAMSRRDILLHVVNHGTYHRGHVAVMMQQCSLHPPTTDFPVFLKSAM